MKYLVAYSVSKYVNYSQLSSDENLISFSLILSSYLRRNNKTTNHYDAWSTLQYLNIYVHTLHAYILRFATHTAIRQNALSL